MAGLLAGTSDPHHEVSIRGALVFLLFAFLVVLCAPQLHPLHEQVLTRNTTFPQLIAVR